ncbi:MAG: hypothetical protein ACREOJ_00895 [Gemmatimonadaceae bacterium]
MNNDMTPELRKRAWTAPSLIRHESLTVLTQSFLGGDLGLQFALLQIPCSITPNNPNCLPGGPGGPPGGGGPPGLGGGPPPGLGGGAGGHRRIL